MDVRQRGRARFGPFSLDLGTGELRKFGIKVLLQSQPFEVLRVLLERAGELVTREELKERIWGSETYVDFDQGLNRAIKKIRASLNDPTDTPKFIETLAKRGYRFAAPVSFDPEAAAVPGEQSPPSISRVAKGRMQLALATGAAALSVVALMSFFLKRHEGAEETRGNLRQLTRNSSENSLINAIISPDGNYLLFGDLTGIHLRLIATQETHTLGRPTGLSTDAAWFPVSWFPDQSRFIAVSAGSTRDGFKIKSWIVSVLKGAITPLRDDAFAQSVSTDGSLISYLSGGPSLDQEIWITGQHGEEGRRLETLNGRGSFAGLEWAPDGHHLAALGRRFRTGNPPEFFIESRDLTDSPPVTVVSQEKVFQSFFWLSDETISYVTIDGGTALWDVHVDRQTGKAVGKPRRTNKWPTADICSISRSRDGKKMVFRRRTNRADVYVGQLDPKGHLGGPRRLTLEDSNNLPYSWTPDSKSVIFVSDRTGNMLPYKQALDQTVAEPIITDGGNNSMPSPSPDGQWILYVLDGGDAQKVMRVPLFGGPAQLIFKAKTGFDLHCPRVPATQCVMATGSEDGQLTFALLNAGDGGSRILYRYSTTYANGDFGGWAVSPDGSEIAVMSSDYQKAEIDVLSLSGQLKQKIGVRGWNRLGGLDYSSDGKSFYTGYLGLSGATLLRVNRAGNAEPLWRRPGTNMGTYAIQSPDGHYLAFMANSSAENAWMIDGI